MKLFCKQFQTRTFQLHSSRLAFEGAQSGGEMQLPPDTVEASREFRDQQTNEQLDALRQQYATKRTDYIDKLTKIANKDPDMQKKLGWDDEEMAQLAIRAAAGLKEMQATPDATDVVYLNGEAIQKNLQALDTVLAKYSSAEYTAPAAKTEKGVPVWLAKAQAGNAPVWLAENEANLDGPPVDIDLDEPVSEPAKTPQATQEAMPSPEDLLMAQLNNPPTGDGKKKTS